MARSNGRTYGLAAAAGDQWESWTDGWQACDICRLRAPCLSILQTITAGSAVLKIYHTITTQHALGQYRRKKTRLLTINVSIPDPIVVRLCAVSIPRYLHLHTIRVTVLRPTQHKIGHFGDVLPNQSLGVVLKKLNLTQRQKTITRTKRKTHKMVHLNERRKTKPKTTLNFQNCCK